MEAAELLRARALKGYRTRNKRYLKGQNQLLENRDQCVTIAREAIAAGQDDAAYQAALHLGTIARVYGEDQ